MKSVRIKKEITLSSNCNSIVVNQLEEKDSQPNIDDIFVVKSYRRRDDLLKNGGTSNADSRNRADKFEYGD